MNSKMIYTNETTILFLHISCSQVPALVEVKEKARITYVTNQNNDGQGWYLTYEPRNQELHMKSSQIILVG